MTDRDPWVLDGDASTSRVALPVMEETVEIGRRTEITGRVRIDVRTQVVDELVETMLEATEMRVERHEINRMLEPGSPVPQQTQDGDTTIIPVIEEVLVVEKRLMLRAELHVTAVTTSEAVTTTVSLRRQTAEITRLGADEAAADPTPDRSL